VTLKKSWQNYVLIQEFAIIILNINKTLRI
jgi:hypothetical protein